MPFSMKIGAQKYALYSVRKNRGAEGVIMLHKKVLKVELHLKYFCEYLDFWRKGSIMFRCIGMYGNIASPHNSNYVVPGM